MKSNKLFLSLLLVFPLFSQAQSDEYLFPISPGNRNYLAGTHAELRSGHFHGGLDIRTGGRTGLSVLATQKGYVSRIKISGSGYGHALYLKHPDGNTSLYGHLDSFEPALEEFVRNYQYENESYEVQIFPEKEQFYYEKGDTIAFSGNSGSSSGPHLHFEIRDNRQRFIDPLLFGFSEIVDNMIPVVKKVAFKTLEENARVNGAFGRYEFDIIYVGNYYTTRKPIELSGKIGIEILHYDYMDGSWARNGIPEITALVDGDTIFRQQKDTLSFGLNRHIMVHMDHPAYAYRRTKFNKLFVDDGNKLDFYKARNSGYVFDPDQGYELKFFLKDRAGNVATFKTSVNKRNVVYDETPSFSQYDIQDNFLHFKTQDSTATIFTGYQKRTISAYMKSRSDYYFLWDLRRGLPDSISSGKWIKPHFNVAIPPGYSFEFYNENFDLKSFPGSLFDTLYLQHRKTFDEERGLEIFSFDQPQVPLKANVMISLKPKKNYADNAAVFATWGNNLSYIGGEKLANGSFRFKTRNLSTYTISYDSIPPVIIPYSWSRSNLRIKIFDEHSGIRSYRATLDGSFLLMHFDKKRDLLRAVPKNPNLPLKGEFILEVEDFLGNKKEIKRIL